MISLPIQRLCLYISNMKSKLLAALLLTFSICMYLPTNAHGIQTSNNILDTRNVLGTKYVLTSQIIDDANQAIREPWCSMALIQPQIVVTAAHCFARPNSTATPWYQPSEIFVTSPGIQAESNKTMRRFPVAQVVLPNDYTNIPVDGVTDISQRNDVAFLILKNPLVLKYSIPVAEASEIQSLKKSNGKVTIFGYGLSSPSQNQTTGPDGMPRSTVANVESVGKVPPFAALESETLIADTIQPSKICEGDSGGPWYAKFGGVLKLVAVQSSGKDPICSQVVSGHAIYPFLNQAYAALAAYKSQPSLSDPQQAIPPNAVKLVWKGGCAARLSYLQSEKLEVDISQDQVNWTPILQTRIEPQYMEEDFSSGFCDWSHPMRPYFYANVPNGTHYKFIQDDTPAFPAPWVSQIGLVTKSDKRYNTTG